MTASARVQSWFEAYLAAPIVIIMYLGFKIWKRTHIKRISEIDVTSGRRELNLAALLAEERAEMATWPRWKKIYKTIC